MLNPRQVAPSHEDIFIERYERLRSWALRLTDNNPERAEDLVQDAFIHFIIARPDLESIINLEGYLYSVLRNLHLSQERRASRSRLQQLSIFEYDTLALALKAFGSLDKMQAQDELRRVCQYSCARKESTRAASILILRFFHGYYPSEIARIVRANRRAVDERLRVARNEARLYLDEPARLRFMKVAPPSMDDSQADTASRAKDILVELRRMIFNSRRGECLTTAELEDVYRQERGEPISITHLAHVVSCAACLEAVNSLLKLTSLNERHPPDMIGKDSAPKGRPTGGGEGGKGRSALFSKYRRSAREVYEHRPRELYFLVNGFIIGSQKITSEVSEQTLDISITEGVGFVEVCSEQDVRLFSLQVEPPPSGAVRQPARADLSDGRSLDLTLTFENAWPTLRTIYHDPLMKAEALNEELAGEIPDAPLAAGTPLVNAPQGHAGWARHLLLAVRIWKGFVGTRVGFLRPGLVTAALALLLISALVLMKMRVSVIDAAVLLQSSIAAEEKLAGNTEQVFHSRLRFEEWADSGGRLVARNRIEVWQSPARELKVRRVFDEQGNLLAGEWVRTNGTSTLYNHGDAPQERAAPELVATALLETGEIWRLGGGAKDFSALTKDGGSLAGRENTDTFIIEYKSAHGVGGGDDAPRLVAATLTLRKSDLRAVEQRLSVERNREIREYRFTEELFEKHPKSHIGRSFFIPDAGLLRPSEKKEADEKSESQDGMSGSAASPPEVSSGVASPELEIEVTYLLNRIKADLGEQVSMTRTTGGALRVQALVENEGRKEEILRALASIINNPAVRVEVNTVGEAARNQPEQSKGRAVTVREVAVANNQIPAYAELRAYFSARVTGGRGLDEEINNYSDRVMNHSRQALLHASALKRLAVRFSPEELRALAPEARQKWLAMIREHAHAYQREVSALRQELRAVFGGAEAGGDEAAEMNMAQSAERLLQLSYANDDAVRSAFTISADGRTTAAIKARSFRRSLSTAERLAGAIEGAYGR
jgi:RNA polymerase sigma factor (sigma-70 family)